MLCGERDEGGKTQCMDVREKGKNKKGKKRLGDSFVVTSVTMD